MEQLPGSHSHIFYSCPTPADRRGIDFTEQGRLSREVSSGLGLPLDADAYLCGPSAFMDELSSGLATYGLDSSRVHSEIFGAAAALTPGIAATSVPPHQPMGLPGPGPEVQFARSGLSAPWGPPNTSLLEFAESCDVPTRWSCRTGVCHNCETPLLSGTVRLRPRALGTARPGEHPDLLLTTHRNSGARPMTDPAPHCRYA